MELKATYVFDASLAQSWDLLMDTNAIAHCLPGCRELRPAGDDRYEVELTVALAAIAGDFKGTVALKDKMPPDSYTLVVEGSGRQGFVKGHGGKIARIGQRMLDGVTRATMKRFYRCLAKQISQPGSTYDPQEEMETEREKEIDEA
jgi:hypothetical protein